MTLDDALSHLRSIPGNEGSTPLLAFKGDLDTFKSRLDANGKAYVNEYVNAGKPYAMVLNLPGVGSTKMLSGIENRLETPDVVFAQQGVNGKAPYERDMTQLVWQTLRLVDHVDELLPGLPLVGKLEVLTIRWPETEFQKPTTLTATVRFRARWKLSL